MIPAVGIPPRIVNQMKIAGQVSELRPVFRRADQKIFIIGVRFSERMEKIACVGTDAEIAYAPDVDCDLHANVTLQRFQA